MAQSDWYIAINETLDSSSTVKKDLYDDLDDVFNDIKAAGEWPVGWDVTLVEVGAKTKKVT